MVFTVVEFMLQPKHSRARTAEIIIMILDVFFMPQSPVLSSFNERSGLSVATKKMEK
jgi:hypothetical protein